MSKFLSSLRIAVSLLPFVMANASASAPKPCGNLFGIHHERGAIEGDLDQWVTRGFLPLNPEELERLKATIPLVHFVCEDRVFRKLGDALTEVSFVNEPQMTPPRADLPKITIGLVRMNAAHIAEMQAQIAGVTSPRFEQRMLLLHEILGAARIPDGEFQKTNVLRAHLQAEWDEFRALFDHHTKRVMEIALQDFDPARVTVYRSLASALFQDPNYARCRRITGDSKKARADKARYCDPLFIKAHQQLTGVISEMISPSRDTKLAERDRLVSELDESVRVQNDRINTRILLHDRREWVFMGEGYRNEVTSRINQTIRDLQERFAVALGDVPPSKRWFISSQEERAYLERACPRALAFGDRAECLRKFLTEFSFDQLEREMIRAREEMTQPLLHARKFELQVLPP